MADDLPPTSARQAGCLPHNISPWDSLGLADDLPLTPARQAGVRRTPCLFLSACRSAGPGTEAALTGVAQRLSQAGVPLVRNAVKVGRQIGHPETAQAEALLASITA